jgi:hypothetical protein
MCVLILLYVCPHTTVCVLMLLYMCLRGRARDAGAYYIYVSSYYYVCVLILLYVFVLILLYVCPHTTVYAS